ncbi:hypothetical protein AIOL_002074 [Candidatus Rhodobacter oscarellae]|uniref:Uncharacterized protein n=1 Tax=Candidatus Rhodobacter oscarellae TaxID=1675527 RepID=A0A0J9E315_9RHOB|nr:hypothetical protein [Candidatus Rhodobacter lobularis]KMW57115.1 hypothetical protein AIOL_002074 [Candidatus Rhodobacter lobularis]
MNRFKTSVATILIASLVVPALPTIGLAQSTGNAQAQPGPLAHFAAAEMEKLSTRLRDTVISSLAADDYGYGDTYVWKVEQTKIFERYNRGLKFRIGSTVARATAEIDALDSALRGASAACDQRQYDELWEQRAIRVISLATYIADASARLDRFYNQVAQDWAAQSKLLAGTFAALSGAPAEERLIENYDPDQNTSMLDAIYEYMRAPSLYDGNVDDIDDIQDDFLAAKQRFLTEYDGSVRDLGRKFGSDQALVEAYFSSLAAKLGKNAVTLVAFDAACGNAAGYCPIDYGPKGRELHERVNEILKPLTLFPTPWELTEQSNRLDGLNEELRAVGNERFHALLDNLVRSLVPDPTHKSRRYFTDPLAEDLADGEGIDIRKLSRKLTELAPEDQDKVLAYFQYLADETDAVREALYQQQLLAEGVDPNEAFKNGEISPIELSRRTRAERRDFWAEEPLDSQVPLQPEVNLSGDGTDDDYGLNTGRILYPLMGPLRNFRTMNEELQADLRARALAEKQLRARVAAESEAYKKAYYEAQSRGEDAPTPSYENYDYDRGISRFLKNPEWMQRAYEDVDADLSQKRLESRQWLEQAMFGVDSIGDPTTAELEQQAEALSGLQNLLNLGEDAPTDWMGDGPRTEQEYDAAWRAEILRDLYETAFPGEDMDALRRVIAEDRAALVETVKELEQATTETAKQIGNDVQEVKPEDAVRLINGVVDGVLGAQADVKDAVNRWDSRFEDATQGALRNDATFDAGAGKCPIPDVIVIDVTNLADYGCGSFAVRMPGQVVSKTDPLTIPLESVYLDVERGALLSPFGPTDILQVCTEQSGDSIAPLRDELGRIVVSAYGQVGQEYSNGYISPTNQQILEMQSLMQQGQSGALQGLFTPPSEPTVIEGGNAGRFIGLD